MPQFKSEVWYNEDGSISGFSLPCLPIQYGETEQEKKDREKKEARMYWDNDFLDSLND